MDSSSRLKSEDAPDGARPTTKRARKAVNCEPCRKSKLKCDKTRPCHGCVVRGYPQLCYADRPDIPSSRPDSDSPNLRGDPCVEIQRMKNALANLECHLASRGSAIGSDTVLNISPAEMLNNSGVYNGPTSAATQMMSLQSDAEFDIQAYPTQYYQPEVETQLLDGLDAGYTPFPDLATCTGLLRFYFDNCTWHYRFVDEYSLAQIWDTLKGAYPTAPLDTALLYSLLAIASQYLPAQHPLRINLSADNVQDLGERYFAAGVRAQRHHDETSSKPTLAYIELLLLQIHYLSIAKHDCERMWRIRGEAVSLGFAMGLHRDPLRFQLPPEVACRRQWAWWNILLVDRWLAFVFGRPIGVLNRQSDTPLPMGTVMPDPTGSLHIPHLHTFSLVRLLGDIMDDVTSVSPVPYDKIDGHDRNLSDWLKFLPADLSQDDYQLSMSLSSLNPATQRTAVQGVALRLMCHHIRFTLHRPYCAHEDVQDPCIQRSLEIGAVSAHHIVNLVAVARGVMLKTTALAVSGHIWWIPFHLFAAGIFLSLQILSRRAGSDARTAVRSAIAALEEFHGIAVADKAHSVLATLAALHELAESAAARRTRVGRLGGLALPCYDGPAARACSPRAHTQSPPSPPDSLRSSDSGASARRMRTLPLRGGTPQAHALPPTAFLTSNLVFDGGAADALESWAASPSTNAFYSLLGPGVGVPGDLVPHTHH